MGCGLCKSRYCEEQPIRLQAPFNPTTPLLKSRTESWVVERVKLFTVNEEASFFEESMHTVRRFDSKPKSSKSIGSVSAPRRNSLY